MKIGIITMHWGRNYGAVLQAYALQEYLIGKGHIVEIINYKPYQYDVHIVEYLLHPWRIKQLKEVLPKERLDKQLVSFRQSRLHLTKRYGSFEELVKADFDYDVYLTGSDQILNPTLTINGDGKPAPVYYLGFAKDNTINIGYAVSFGCTVYPEKAKHYAREWIENFQALGVREDSGLDILDSFGYEKHCIVVPDPTLLLGKTLFKECDLHPLSTNNQYYYIHVLRSRSIDLSEKDIQGIPCIDSSNGRALSMENWLNTIYNSKSLITNSYHAMIMAILMHRPFVIILENGRMTGMNDRFYTLLNRIGLESRIADNNSENISTVLNQPIDWDTVDALVERYRAIGSDYLNEQLNK